MNAFYVQKADEICPIYGVNSLDQAKAFVAEEDHARVVETSDKVYMNTETGSVDFASGWDDLDEVVEVEFDANSETWVESKE